MYRIDFQLYSHMKIMALYLDYLTHCLLLLVVLVKQMSSLGSKQQVILFFAVTCT